jgi:hypothetical protein
LEILVKGISASHGERHELGEEDLHYLREREGLVSESIRAGNVAAKALHEIHAYRDGALWRSEFPCFQAYCTARWGYTKAHCYRLLDHGRFLADVVASESPRGDLPEPLEGQVRPLLKSVPNEFQVECWNNIASKEQKITGSRVKKLTEEFLEQKGLKPKTEAKPKLALPVGFRRTSVQEAKSALTKLRDYVACRSAFDRMESALTLLDSLIKEDSQGHEPEVSSAA